MKVNCRYYIDELKSGYDILNKINEATNKLYLKYRKIEEIKLNRYIAEKILNDENALINSTIIESEENINIPNSITGSYEGIPISSDTTLKNNEVVIVCEN